jgi:hypothetical protein
MHYRELTRELKVLADDIPHYNPKRRKLSPAQVRWLLGYDGVGGLRGGMKKAAASNKGCCLASQRRKQLQIPLYIQYKASAIPAVTPRTNSNLGRKVSILGFQIKVET